MLIYKRYIIKNIVPSLVIIIFSVTSLVWITQILNMLYLIDRGIKVQDFLNLIILVIPSLLFILLPFTTVIAVIYTYNALSERRQIIILQNLGLNNIQLASPALMVSLIVTLFSYYISTSVLPLSYNKLKSDITFMKNNYASNMLDEKTFNTISKDITVYFDKKLPDGTMKSLIIFDNRKRDNHAILFSKLGVFKIYNNISSFQLKNGVRQVYDHNGNLNNLLFEVLTVELVSNDGKKLVREKYNREINEYYIDELLKPNNILSEQRKIKLIAEGHQRLIWPMYNFVLVFLTLSVFLQQPYNKKSSLRQILITALSAIIITYLHFLLQNLASKDLNFIFACYANIIIAIILSLYLYFRRTI
ncbi:LptF/LptG family permease [Candidatus Tisiphia endosymbiont of Hybos culiciformis]|uniref:LptF/LptG family permease n=1 Tax=Candidatus Tisiphia endosymbiont of Hybos culiciformis TaxID=3139331 RepID=UPI003CCB044F